jgi:hypothetical protein
VSDQTEQLKSALADRYAIERPLRGRASMIRTPTAFLVLAFLYPAVPAQSQVAITGTVTDSETGAPLSGVSVELLRNGVAITTILSDRLGRYSFADVGVGWYALAFARLGYAPQRVDERHIAEGTARIDIALVQRHRPSSDSRDHRTHTRRSRANRARRGFREQRADSAYLLRAG